MEEQDVYLRELAEYLLRKHKPTKLELLKIASVDHSGWLGFPCPYPLTNAQFRKCLSFGIHEESCDYYVFAWILALSFPEFRMDIHFFLCFAGEHKFWQLNLEYFKKTQKTIFEVYAFPTFDWDTRRFWIIQRIENMDDEEAKREDERQMQLLREYGEKVMQIAVDAVAYLN